MTLLLGIPLGIDPESPEGRRIRVELINRSPGLGRVSLIEGHAGISVVSLDAKRAERTRKGPRRRNGEVQISQTAGAGEETVIC